MARTRNFHWLRMVSDRGLAPSKTIAELDRIGAANRRLQRILRLRWQPIRLPLTWIIRRDMRRAVAKLIAAEPTNAPDACDKILSVAAVMIATGADIDDEQQARLLASTARFRDEVAELLCSKQPNPKPGSPGGSSANAGD